MFNFSVLGPLGFDRIRIQQSEKYGSGSGLLFVSRMSPALTPTGWTSTGLFLFSQVNIDLLIERRVFRLIGNLFITCLPKYETIKYVEWSHFLFLFVNIMKIRSKGLENNPNNCKKIDNFRSCSQNEWTFNYFFTRFVLILPNF